MIRFLTLCLFLFSIDGFTQKDTAALQEEINQEVWNAFQNAFQTLDGEALNATYAETVLRVTPSGIDTQNSFKAKNLERFMGYEKEGVSITLDFWFDSRHTNTTASYEVGFYRIGFIKNNETTYSYGQFHIVIQKLNGQWKITQDWDTDTINGEKIGAQDFGKRAPLKF
ncbi:hypothetical protein [Croceitalea vernalis]|uniref:DUF4440 domain-containing protein n=1 Tax=Croceitalea vernalis TaxID=3075599 RepID=A0ABU3BF33_9FLAO|nr:hypothetical protein [Croceitalea sp. P007]MDT0620738.1 hypothetical protein [Croceitalea sp. P007]